MARRKERSKRRTRKNKTQPKKDGSLRMENEQGTKQSMVALEEILGSLLERAGDGQDAGLLQGIENIASMVPFNAKQGSPQPVPGVGVMVPGLMAFRRRKQNLDIAFVGGKFPVFYLPLDKLVLAVERMHDPKRRTVIVQNCSESEDEPYARGQILARFVPGHSALRGAWGVKGKVITGPDDISKSGAYYIKREDLLRFYLAAKAQLKGGDLLEELLRANEGWREYDLPTNPLDPGAV